MPLDSFLPVVALRPLAGRSSSSKYIDRWCHVDDAAIHARFCKKSRSKISDRLAEDVNSCIKCVGAVQPLMPGCLPTALRLQRPPRLPLAPR